MGQGIAACCPRTSGAGAGVDADASVCRRVEAVRVTREGVERLVETVAVESRVDLWVDGAFWGSSAVSPEDLEDFACGLALSSGLVPSLDQVARVEVDRDPTNLSVRLWRSPLCLSAVRARESMSSPFVGVLPPRADDARAATCAGGRASGCAGGCRDGSGPCGPLVAPEAVWKVSGALLPRQGMHRATGATHAALFADEQGEVVLMREDVGRHNAVDKLLGALARQGIDPAGGFVYLSSRCALELVAKCARVGVRMVATVSAPTSAVLDFADREGVTLCAFAREGRFTVYTHGERIAGLSA